MWQSMAALSRRLNRSFKTRAEVSLENWSERNGLWQAEGQVVVSLE